MTTLVDSRCLACGSGRLSPAESIPASALAEAWERERRRPSGMGLNGEASRSILETLGSAEVRFDRCEDCGLEMGSPRRVWLQGAYEGAQDYPERWEFGRFLDDLGPTPSSVLEPGCGTGAFLRQAQQRGHTTLGIDFNRDAVDEACRRGLVVLPGGFEHLDRHIAAHGTKPTFDAIAMFHVIEHLSDPREVFEDLARFASPGTKLGISCPGPRRFTKLIREDQLGAGDFWDYPPHHVVRWTLPALHRFLGDCGWRVVHGLEEPLGWLGASSQIAISRATRHGYLTDPVRRRLGIVRAMVQVLASAHAVKGLSIYVFAERVGPR